MKFWTSIICLMIQQPWDAC